MFIENERINRVHVTKFLGIFIDDKLNWKHHINTVRSKLSKVAAIIYRASCNKDGIYTCCTAPYFCHILTIVVKYGETRICYKCGMYNGITEMSSSSSLWCKTPSSH